MAIESLETLKDDLMDYLDGENDRQRFTSEEDSSQPFRIQNLDQANWAVRKIARIEMKRRQCRELVEAETNRLKSWLEAREQEASRERSFFESLLRSYLEEQRQSDVRLKSIKLPAGSVGLRKQQPEFIRDNERLLAWLKANHPELIKVQESPDWAGLKEASLVQGGTLADPETGEVVDGVKVVERPERLVVDFN